MNFNAQEFIQEETIETLPTREFLQEHDSHPHNYVQDWVKSPAKHVILRSNHSYLHNYDDATMDLHAASLWPHIGLRFIGTNWMALGRTSPFRMDTPTEMTERLSFQDAEIAAAIQEAQSLVDLENDWDGEGSPGYSRATLDRATDFLLRNASQAWESRGIRIPAPVIGPSDNGSIDIHWETLTRRLLLTIPANGEQLATYYGDDRVGRKDTIDNSIEGRLSIAADNVWLLVWLTA